MRALFTPEKKGCGRSCAQKARKGQFQKIIRVILFRLRYFRKHSACVFAEDWQTLRGLAVIGVDYL